METLIRWLVGIITISLVIGAVGTHLFLKKLRSHIRIPKDVGASSKYDAVPGWLIGFVERLFFTIIVAFNVPGTAIAMIAWVATKMLSNWHRPSRDDIKAEDIVPISLSALLGSLVSMFFALIGGLICQGKIWW